MQFRPMNLTTKFRPSRLDDVVGQDHAVSALTGMLKSGKVPPTILISGPFSSGKTTLARIISLRLVCREAHNTAEGCRECKSCQRMLAALHGGHPHPDVAEINAASEKGIDMIRSLSREARFAPTLSPYRLFILDEAHALTDAAFQAALKLFEEPPPSTRFILCTTNPEKMGKTIMSRCHQIRLNPVDQKSCARLLTRVCKAEHFAKRGATKELVREIAAAVDGHPRDGLNLLEQVMNAGEGQEDLVAALPKVMEQSSFAPYIMTQRYLGSLFSGQYGASLLAVQKVGGAPDFFIGRVIETLQQVLYIWVNKSALSDPAKAWYLKGVEIPDASRDVKKIQDVAKLLDIFLDVQGRLKTYLCDPHALIDAGTIKALAVTGRWKSKK